MALLSLILEEDGIHWERQSAGGWMASAAKHLLESGVQNEDVIEQHGKPELPVSIKVNVNLKHGCGNVDTCEIPGQERDNGPHVKDKRGLFAAGLNKPTQIAISWIAALHTHHADTAPTESACISRIFSQHKVVFVAQKQNRHSPYPRLSKRLI